MQRSPALLTFLLLSALLACGSGRPRLQEFDQTHSLILCVANESYSAGPIRVWIDEVRALTVESGRRECHRLRDVSSPPRLYAVSTAGGFDGPTQYRAQIESMGIRCWDWVLRDDSVSQIRLIPCDVMSSQRSSQ